MTQNDIEIIYSIQETLKILKLGRTSLYQEIKAGRLPAKKYGKRTFIRVQDMEKWAADLPAYTGGLIK